MAHTENTEARQRVLLAAEQLFAKKGYTAVTLRDIAAEVGIRHASLYHHVPGGKEALFIEVSERTFERHRAGLMEAMSAATPNIRAQLCAAADWLLSQPPMDLIRMVYSDMPAINPDQAHRLSEAAYDAMLSPLEQVLEQAKLRGEIDHADLGLVAGGLLGMIEALHSVPNYALTTTRPAMAYTLIDTMLNGLRQR